MKRYPKRPVVRYKRRGSTARRLERMRLRRVFTAQSERRWGIASATGEDLDRIASTFGIARKPTVQDSLGLYPGETDEELRSRLKEMFLVPI